MHTVPQRLLAAVAVLAAAVALYNQQIGAGLVGAGAMVASAVVTVIACGGPTRTSARARHCIRVRAQPSRLDTHEATADRLGR
jgi:hypothetical protein